MAVRHLIYGAMPASDFETWFARDLIMSVPRLAGFAACLAVARGFGDWRSWGWGRFFRGDLAGWLLLLAAVAMEVLGHLAAGSGSSFGPGLLLAGWLSTVPVALFEETAFRSLLFLALRERFHVLPAALISSVLFAVYHFEAQPIAMWPHIFIFGVAACAALQRGVSMPALILAHLFVDGAWFHVVGEGGKAHFFVLNLLTGALTLAASLVSLGQKTGAGRGHADMHA